MCHAVCLPRSAGAQPPSPAQPQRPPFSRALELANVDSEGEDEVAREEGEDTRAARGGGVPPQLGFSPAAPSPRAPWTPRRPVARDTSGDAAAAAGSHEVPTRSARALALGLPPAVPPPAGGARSLGDLLAELPRDVSPTASTGAFPPDVPFFPRSVRCYRNTRGCRHVGAWPRLTRHACRAAPGCGAGGALDGARDPPGVPALLGTPHKHTPCPSPPQLNATVRIMSACARSVHPLARRRAHTLSPAYAPHLSAAGPYRTPHRARLNPSSRPAAPPARHPPGRAPVAPRLPRPAARDAAQRPRLLAARARAAGGVRAGLP